MPETHFTSLSALEAHLALMAVTPSEEAPGLTELDHGLQCAAELKLSAPEDEALQVAGLVHDVGHGLSHIRTHADTGEEAVRAVLGERIAALVGLHVDAKRYLVTTDPDYRGKLSPTSIKTLALQGGDMTPDEVAAFEARPHWREGLLLRRADEAAKTVGRDVPGLETWLPILRAQAAAQA